MLQRDVVSRAKLSRAKPPPDTHVIVRRAMPPDSQTVAAAATEEHESLSPASKEKIEEAARQRRAENRAGKLAKMNAGKKKVADGRSTKKQDAARRAQKMRDAKGKQPEIVGVQISVEVAETSRSAEERAAQVHQSARQQSEHHRDRIEQQSVRNRVEKLKHRDGIEPSNSILGKRPRGAPERFEPPGSFVVVKDHNGRRHAYFTFAMNDDDVAEAPQGCRVVDVQRLAEFCSNGCLGCRAKTELKLVSEHRRGLQSELNFS